MMEIRRREDRGTTRRDWLEGYHSFSFGEYQDPNHIRFGPLRVLNEDFVAPGGGFPTHPHRDAEVITYVLSGALEHRDSTGNRGIIRPFEIQRMRAGRGITHSEMNASDTKPVHLLQIWILPDRLGLEPAYDQITLDPDSRKGRFQTVLTPGGEGETIDIAQNATLRVARLEPGESATHSIATGRGAYLHVAGGAIEANEQTLRAGDGAKVWGEEDWVLRAVEPSELVLIDIPM